MTINEVMKKFEETRKYTGSQLKEIRYGLEQKLDVNIYAKPEFSHQQMEQIA